MRRLSQAIAGEGGSRWLENVGFLLALLVGTGYVVVVEMLPAVGWQLGDCGQGHHHGFPVGLFVMMGIFAAPKMLGRATAGRIWERIAGRGKPSDES